MSFLGFVKKWVSFHNHSMDFNKRPRKMKLRMRALHFCYLNDDIIFEISKYFVIHLVNIERTENNIICWLHGIYQLFWQK